MERTVLTESTRLSLLRVLLADEDGARASADRLSHSNGWSAAFKTAEAWSVAPQLAERVRQLVLQPPPAEWQEFKQVVIANYARSASRASRGIAAIRQLEIAGFLQSPSRGWHPWLVSIRLPRTGQSKTPTF